MQLFLMVNTNLLFQVIGSIFSGVRQIIVEIKDVWQET